MASISIFPTLDRTVSAVYIALIASMGLGIVSLGSLSQVDMSPLTYYSLSQI
jgi:hypothetical protein